MLVSVEEAVLWRVCLLLRIIAIAVSTGGLVANLFVGYNFFVVTMPHDIALDDE